MTNVSKAGIVRLNNELGKVQDEMLPLSERLNDTCRAAYNCYTPGMKLLKLQLECLQVKENHLQQQLNTIRYKKTMRTAKITLGFTMIAAVAAVTSVFSPLFIRLHY